MPPKKAAAAKKAPSAPPLQGCIIALSGTFPGYSQAKLEKDFINALGATISKTVNEDTTHLVTNDADFAKPSVKVKQAKSHDIHIVGLAWLEECLKQSTRLGEDKYALETASNGTAAPAANGSRKRAVVKDESDAEEDDPPAQPKKKAKSANTNGTSKQSQSMSQASNGAPAKAKPTLEDRSKREVSEAGINIAKDSNVNLPVDEACPLTNYRVYIDKDGLIFDASLNQTNASNNNNKFYRLQLLRSGNGDYKTWTRWGRVGERGQSAILGNGSVDDALREFNSKFKSKSGLAWADRGANPKPNKYTFVERSYGDDGDEEMDDATKTEVKKEVKKEPSEEPASKLDQSIQDLMALIFNQQYFAATMTDLNYDVNKLPLGKLSKNTITRGYQALKDLSNLLNDPSLAQSEYGLDYQAAAEHLSNTFYSFIPHAFGRNRPPVIRDTVMLKREVDLLDSLSDMKDASNIMKVDTKNAERVNLLDQQFRGLNLDEMTPLSTSSNEFTELKQYLVETRGATHNANYQVDAIFRIERQGEKERFEKSPYAGPPRDRRLLWHGSRATNFGGILSQGLRIAPPEAPVNGYMFGKGIYLADMSSKSANYCCSYVSNGQALLLLCEAELGDPMQILTSASYTAGEDAKAKGLSSTWGQGQVGPSKWKDAGGVHPSLKGIKIPDTTIKPGRTNVNGAYLQYNEFITYDIAQVRLRYLFRVRM